METLDKTYLEISQITSARNSRELEARKLMMRIIEHLNNPLPNESDSTIIDDAHVWLMNDMGDEQLTRWYSDKDFS